MRNIQKYSVSDAQKTRIKKKGIRLLGHPSLFPEFWWRITDSNRGHKDYDSSALTD